MTTVSYSIHSSTEYVLPPGESHWVYTLLCCLQCFDAVGWVAGRASPSGL